MGKIETPSSAVSFDSDVALDAVLDVEDDTIQICVEITPSGLNVLYLSPQSIERYQRYGEWIGEILYIVRVLTLCDDFERALVGDSETSEARIFTTFRKNRVWIRTYNTRNRNEGLFLSVTSKAQLVELVDALESTVYDPTRK